MHSIVNSAQCSYSGTQDYSILRLHHSRKTLRFSTGSSASHQQTRRELDRRLLLGWAWRGKHNFCLGSIGQNCCMAKPNYRKAWWICCSFPGRKGNQFSKNTYIPRYGVQKCGCATLRCVFAVAWISLEGLRGAAFCKRRGCPWWMCSVLCGFMMSSREI